MKFFIYLFLFSCLLLSCEKHQVDQTIALSPNEKAVNKLLSRLAKDFEKKYNIRPIGTNVAMHGGIVRMLGLDFQVLGPLSQEQIRKILIKLVQKFLEEINSDLILRPFLEKYPFKIEDINIILFFNDSKGYEIDDPYFGVAEIDGGELSYKTLAKNDGILNFVNEIYESYEEALTKL